ncbi:MAG: hypothetical protein ACYTFT_03485 [Planctomycetota bacterium]|jgi:hypothetical protein
MRTFAIALAATLVGLLAPSASADQVRLITGETLEGTVVIYDREVEVYTDRGAFVIGREMVSTIQIDAPHAHPTSGDPFDPDGLFAAATRAEEEGDFRRATRLRERAGELFVRREARTLLPEDTEGWARLRHLAGLLNLDAVLVPGLLAARSNEERTLDPFRSRPKTQVTSAEPRSLDPMVRLARLTPPARPATQPPAGLTNQRVNLEKQPVTWQTARSYRGPRAPIVVLYRRDQEPQRSTSTDYHHRFIVGGHRVGGGRRNLDRQPTRRTGFATFDAANAQGGTLFRTLGAQRTLADQINSSRPTTFQAAGQRSFAPFRVGR